MVWFLIEEHLSVIHTSHVPLVCVPCEPYGSALQSQVSLRPRAKDPFTHRNMEQKHAHVSWKTIATNVMVTVLLLLSATAEAWGDIQ